MNIWQKVKRFGKILWDTGKEFAKEEPFGHAAEIAFYTIFSMPGVLIVAVSIASSFYDRELVTGGIMDQISYLVGPNSAEQVQKVLENARTSADSSVARFVGVVTLLFSATTVFVSLQSALNKIWDIRPKPKKGFLKLIIDRALSFAMIISIGFLLLVSLLLDAAIVFLGSSIQEYIGVDIMLAGVINFLLSVLVIAVIFALLFKVLPDAVVAWNDVWSGAILTTALFMMGKFLIGFYLGNSSVGNAYGAAGSLVLLLVWIYYSSIILLFGAQFTHVYSVAMGKKIRPSKHAVKIKVIEVESE